MGCYKPWKIITYFCTYRMENLPHILLTLKEASCKNNWLCVQCIFLITWWSRLSLGSGAVYWIFIFSLYTSTSNFFLQKACTTFIILKSSVNVLKIKKKTTLWNRGEKSGKKHNKSWRVVIFGGGFFSFYFSAFCEFSKIINNFIMES